eukprot:8884464-Alexandrium_andersonii.AAC.1
MGKGPGLPQHWLRNGIENSTAVPRGGARGSRGSDAASTGRVQAASTSGGTRGRAAAAHLGVGSTPGSKRRAASSANTAAARRAAAALG